MWKLIFGNPAELNKVSPGNSLRRSGAANSRVGVERGISRSALGSFRAKSMKKVQSAWIQSSDDNVTDFSLTWWGSFDDKLQREKFQAFLRRDFNGTLLFAMLFLIAFFFQPAMIAHFVAISKTLRGQRGHDEFVRHSWLAILSTLSTLFVLLIPGILVLYLRLWKYRLTISAVTVRPPMIYTRLFPHIKKVEAFFFFGTLITFGLMLFARLYGGKCELPEDLANPIFCNKETEVGSLPQDSIFALILLPGFLTLAVKGGLSWQLTVAHWLLSFFFLIASMAYGEAWNSKILILFSLFEGVRLLTIHRQNINIYTSALDHNKFMVERMESENKQARAEEMRNFIANTAHDLKSPMQAFANSISTLRESVNDALAAAAGRKTSTSYSYEESSRRTTPRCSIMVLPPSQRHSKSLLHDTSPIERTLLPCIQVLDDMVVTCEFMNMSLNRALDYSKVSRGIALIPSFQCTHIGESVEYAAKCMRSLQDSIEIIVHPLPEDFFPFIITDRQWLNENLLCVLSNAIKFSYIGPVEIKVEVVEQKPAIARSRLLSRKDSILLSNNDAPGYSSANAVVAASGAQKQDMIKITVVDRGIGITTDAAVAAFRPMDARRNKTDRHSGGAGLGLYSLSKRVEALGGRCGIKQRRDGFEGTICWFTEPYRPDFSSPSSESSPPEDEEDEKSEDANSPNQFPGSRRVSELQRSSFAAASSVVEKMFRPNHEPVYSPNAGMTNSGSRGILGRTSFLKAAAGPPQIASSSRDQSRHRAVSGLITGKNQQQQPLFDGIHGIEPVMTIQGRDSTAYASSGNLHLVDDGGNSGGGGAELGNQKGALLSNAARTALEPTGESDLDLVSRGGGGDDNSNHKKTAGVLAMLGESQSQQQQQQQQETRTSSSSNRAGGGGVFAAGIDDIIKTPLLAPIYEGMESPKMELIVGPRQHAAAGGGGRASAAASGTMTDNFLKGTMTDTASNFDKVSGGGGTVAGAKTTLGRPRSLATLSSAANNRDAGQDNDAARTALASDPASTRRHSITALSLATPGSYLVKMDSSAPSYHSSGGGGTGTVTETTGTGTVTETTGTGPGTVSVRGVDKKESPRFARESSERNGRLSRITSSAELMSLPSLRILVVDDSLPILRTIARTMEKARHTVETAQNGAVALNLMKEKEYDVVLMDIQMPVMDGIEAVESFRKFESSSCLNLAELDRITSMGQDLNSATIITGIGGGGSQRGLVDRGSSRRCLVIGVSANSDSDTAAKAIGAGMDRFMPKPFTMKQFQDVVLQEMPHLVARIKSSMASSVAASHDHMSDPSTTGNSYPGSRSPTITHKKSHSPSFNTALRNALAAVQNDSESTSPVVAIDEVRSRLAETKARDGSPPAAAAAVAARQGLSDDENLVSGYCTPVVPLGKRAHPDGTGTGTGAGTGSHTPYSRSPSRSVLSRGGAEISVGQLKILVVDDSLPILRTIARTLEKARHTVETAQNGAIALNLMKEKEYDVVLMDIQMPVMDGIEAVEQLRAYEKSSLRPEHQSSSSKWNGTSSENSSSGSRRNVGAGAYGGGHDNISKRSIRELGGEGKGGEEEEEDSDGVTSPSQKIPPRHQIVIGVSANSDSDTASKALAAGMNKFMPKPFTISQFTEAFSQLRPDLVKHPRHATPPRALVTTTSKKDKHDKEKSDSSHSSAGSPVGTPPTVTGRSVSPSPSPTTTPATASAVIVGGLGVGILGMQQQQQQQSSSLSGGRSDDEGDGKDRDEDGNQLLAAAAVLNQPTPMTSPGFKFRSHRSSLQSEANDLQRS